MKNSFKFVSKNNSIFHCQNETVSAKFVRMQKGFNSDVDHDGGSYHIQSEDWGFENPFLVSRVYLNGAVVKNIKTSYRDILKPSSLRDPGAIRLALIEQHQNVLDQLVSGQLI